MPDTPSPACVTPGAITPIPGGTPVVLPEKDVELGGALCDILNGQVVGYAWPEFTYDEATGAITATRLINPVTGGTYVPQGVMQPCPGGDITVSRVCASISGGTPVELDAHYLWSGGAAPSSVIFTIPGTIAAIPSANISLLDPDQCGASKVYMPVCVMRTVAGVPEYQTLWAVASPTAATVYYDPITSPLQVVPTAQFTVIDEGHCGSETNCTESVCVNVGADIWDVRRSFSDTGIPSYFDVDPTTGALVDITSTVTGFRHDGICNCERDS